MQGGEAAEPSEAYMVKQDEETCNGPPAEASVCDERLTPRKRNKEAKQKIRDMLLANAKGIQKSKNANAFQALADHSDAERQLLETALNLETNRQHQNTRYRVLLRRAERLQRLQDKRLVEKQRFLAAQEEAMKRRHELAGVINAAQSSPNSSKLKRSHIS